MLRNWVTQFGFSPGTRAGDERISNEDRGKFINQVGAYLGWNPPHNVNWSVEVTREENGEYIFSFNRYATKDEVEKLLGTNYKKYETDCDTQCEPQPARNYFECDDSTPAKNNKK